MRSALLRSWVCAGLAALAALAAPQPAAATPQYARENGVRCTLCHMLPPLLNPEGQAFAARGYRLRQPRPRFPVLPFALRVSGRWGEPSARELSGERERSALRVELSSGGALGEAPLAYRVQWLPVSQELARVSGPGGARAERIDRGGRFADAFVRWEFAPEHSLRLGQFRALGQLDVSARLSLAEPSLLASALPGAARGDPLRARDERRAQLRAFAPAGRSPALAYEFRSIPGDSASDGLFHRLVLPFAGELSLPLSSEAREWAGLEFEGPAKGVFAETFYRRGLDSLGVHGFAGRGRWLVSGLATLERGQLLLSAGAGIGSAAAQEGSRGPRTRYSAQLEYLPTFSSSVRPGFGVRLEHESRGPAGSGPALIPYFALAAPNADYSFSVQLQYRLERDRSGFALDASAMF